MWAAAWAVVSGLLAVGAGMVLRAGPWPLGIRVGVSLAPVVPLTAYCILAIRGVHQLDELQTRIQLEGGLIGFFATIWGLVLLGLLAKAGVIPDWPLTQVWPWIWVAWGLLWAVGGLIAGRRYR